MIERLLAAESALERGDAATAQRLFGQVAEADPRNAMAVVGLARLATSRGELDEARTWLRRALEIDPDEAAARRLLAELDSPATAANQEPAAEPARKVPPPTAMHPLSLLGRLRRWLHRGRP